MTDKPSTTKTKIDILREELIELQKKREKVTMEKGLIADDNKDLRENAAYDFYEQQERNITSRIYNIIKDIESLSKKK